ncbi:MAG TPA: polyprenyl synthetase family protein [bacterium]|nr:polyprenyl synthetase family protein [bacterium]HQG44982.1 polyprenyl synthetase family protein [bacterium]HQI47124.1 polyprenyl synthetase family protein [bacterium]HQJ63158.1 polyprenyl synthetase family protein [bacterium]
MIPTLEERLAACRALIQEHFQHLVSQDDPPELYEPMRYALAQPGKQLRPTLLLLCAEAAGGRMEQALDAALAIEVIHTFTLVHDDIMDHDELRRGRPTVHRRWDENVALLAGDGLLVLGYALLARLEPRRVPEILQLYSSAILEICEGQALDKAFETRSEISLESYYRMIHKKTGRLFALACEAGAILGGGDAGTVAALGTYGAMVGRAFQLQDDLLDVLGDEKTIGKDVGSDLEENKKTFLITHARGTASPGQRERLNELTAARPLTRERLAEIIALFNEIGSISAAHAEIGRSLQAARIALSPLPQNAASRDLTSLLETIAGRTF